jgi:hypothetical protein
MVEGGSMSRRRSSSSGPRFHWRPWVGIPVPGTDHLLRENWSKSGPSTTFGPRLRHRTVSAEWVTDTWDLLYWLPWPLRYFRRLGRFQRRRHRDAPRRLHHHGCLLLMGLAVGAGISMTPLGGLGWAVMGLALLGIWAGFGRTTTTEEETG